jgi:hypothetical protein
MDSVQHKCLNDAPTSLTSTVRTSRDSANHKTLLCCVYIRGEESYLWDQKLSVRSNQDNQREYEERAVRRMAALLTRRTCADSPSLYARMHSHSHGYHGPHAHSVWNSHIIPQGKFHFFDIQRTVHSDVFL